MQRATSYPNTMKTTNRLEHILVDIIIINWNASDAVIRCIDSIYTQRNYSFNVRVIVVDNHSYLAQREKLLAFVSKHGDVHLCMLDRNHGYGGGANAGAAHAVEHLKDATVCHYFWFLNHDVVIAENSFFALERFLQVTHDASLIGTVALRQDHETIECFGGVKYNRWLGRDAPLFRGRKLNSMTQSEKNTRGFSYLQGASFLMSSSVFASVGGFDERYFLYYEELRLATILSEQPLLIAHEVIVFHGERGLSARKRKLNDICAFHAAASCLLYSWEHDRKRFLSVFLVRGLYLFVQGICSRSLRKCTLMFSAFQRFLTLRSQPCSSFNVTKARQLRRK